MRKILLIASVALVTNLTNAQTIIQDNFNSYPVGNLSTDITGTLPGQGGWYAFAGGANANVTNFQVVANNATHVKALSITGSAASTGGKQLEQEAVFNAGWAARTQFNDIAIYEFDYFTGPATTSTNVARVNIWDTVSSKALIGFVVNQSTKVPSYLVYSNPCNVIAGLCPNGNEYTAGNYNYTFNAEGGGTFALEANTWYKVGLAWDANTGETALKIINETTGVTVLDDSIFGDAAGSTPDFAAIQVLAVPSSTTTNAVASTNLFDNIVVKASDEINLLAVNDVVKANTSVSVYPNPTSDFLKFDSKSKVDAVQVYDMSGKSVNVQVLNNQVDVRNLAKGTYVVKIQTAEGTSTQKFIKK